MSDWVYWLIIAILGLIVVYLALRLKYSEDRYDGRLVVTSDPETGVKTFSLELDKSPEEIQAMGNISFKVILEYDA